jgi:uridylate kinase
LGQAPLRFRRVVLKITGEALGENGRGLDMASVRGVAREIQAAHDAGAQAAVVVGAGNLVRGRDVVRHGVPESVADAMGMTATVINGIALHQALEDLGVPVLLQSAVAVGRLVPAFSRRDSLRCLDAGGVVVCAGGTGNPHFTTDTGAALRAREFAAEAVLKATNVDGVYSADPKKDPSAVRYKRLSYRQVIVEDLKVMDLAAVALCRDGGIPIVVFDLGVQGNVLRAVRGEDIGTFVGEG